jgi:hypothetical protein
MRVEIIRAPSPAFLEMLLNNIRPSERRRVEGKWGAVGLIQSKLIDLYRASDVAEKSSNVVTALVMGNCPQHIQMLAIFGAQAEVDAAAAKISLLKKSDAQ